MMQPVQSLLQLKHEVSPHKFAEFLISQGDSFWWERGKFWVVTKYKTAEAILKSPDWSADRSSFFISRMPNLDLKLIRDFFGVIGQMMVMSDAEEHKNRRRIGQEALNETLLQDFMPSLDKKVSILLEKHTQTGSFNFATIAQELPSWVLAELFCIPEKDRAFFYEWSNTMTQFFGGASQYRNEDGIEVNKAAIALRDYFAELIENQTGDFLNTMIRSARKMGLEPSEIISQAVMMLVAGQITTTDQFNNNFYLLLTTPGLWKTLRENPEKIAAAMEECSRQDPGVTFLFRVAKNATKIDGHEIQPGAVVFISNHAVNRDPEFFSDPFTFRLDRKQNPHMAYGSGPHYCIGARLARLQMNACFGYLLKNFAQLHLDPYKAPKRKHHSLAFSGFEELWATSENNLGKVAIPTPVLVRESGNHLNVFESAP